VIERPALDASVIIRDARDDDAAGLIELIGTTFAEYPGCVLDVDGEMPQLRAIATWSANEGGRFWTAHRGGVLIGCGGLAPAHEGPGVELKHLYVAKSARKMGIGSAFVGMIEDEAQRRGARFIELWSDTRFLDAHRLYEHLGYTRLPDTRELNDLSNSVEFHFEKHLA